MCIINLFKLNSYEEKLFLGLFALALLATTAVGVAESRKSEATMSDLAMANVEALAGGEGPTYTRYCYYLWSNIAGMQYISCYSCQVQYNQQGYTSGTCTLNL